jgi:hypothetical protein
MEAKYSLAAGAAKEYFEAFYTTLEFPFFVFVNQF